MKDDGGYFQSTPPSSVCSVAVFPLFSFFFVCVFFSPPCGLIKGRGPRIQLEPLPRIADLKQSARQDMVIQKLQQCCCLFDFSDPLQVMKKRKKKSEIKAGSDHCPLFFSQDLKSKEIKRAAINELIDYLNNNRQASFDGPFPPGYFC